MSLKIKISILAICFALLAAVCVGFAFAAPNEKLNLKGTLSYEVPKPVVMVSPNDPDLGSTTGSGDYTIGETVILTATPSSSSNSFLAWATSTDPNEMEIVSTSPTYSFEFLESSPKDYYALFNKTTFYSQTVGNLKYTFYKEAKLASVTDTTSTTVPSGNFAIPSVVSSGENSYKVFSIGRSAFYDCSGLTSITIPEGVTSIGGHAFQYCSSLTSITIPEGVTSIDEWAFNGCRSLTSISIPEGVTSIGEYAFQDCRSLTSITIPEGVTSIGSNAFSGCSSLTEITIPKGVTSIGEGVFQGCSSLKAFYGDGNEYYTIDENSALLVGGGKTLLAYAPANTATSYTIPEGVTSIGGSAFDGCSGLTTITLPSTLTSIGGSAFSGCSGLTSIIIPEGVTAIGDHAFFNCYSLTSITIPEGVASIGEWAFTQCYILTSVTLPTTLTSIGSHAFYNCHKLAIVYNNSSLKITAGSTGNGYVGYYAKEVVSSGEEAVVRIEIVDDVQYYVNEQTGENIALAPSVSRDSLTSVTIREGTTEINEGAFQGCSSLTTITIPEGVTSIGEDAFHNCSNLTSVSLPSTLTSIGRSAFYGCSKLTSITIPEGVTSIDWYTFYGCDSLTSITIPEGVTSIGGSAFENCDGLTEIIINGNITNLDWYGGIFVGCDNLTKLTLGKKVTTLPSDPDLFDALTHLTEIVVEEGSTLDENIALPSYATWYKDNDPTPVTSFDGAGIYSTTKPA